MNGVLDFYRAKELIQIAQKINPHIIFRYADLKNPEQFMEIHGYSIVFPEADVRRVMHKIQMGKLLSENNSNSNRAGRISEQQSVENIIEELFPLYFYGDSKSVWTQKSWPEILGEVNEMYKKRFGQPISIATLKRASGNKK